jgi:hypothetical protein
MSRAGVPEPDYVEEPLMCCVCESTEDLRINSLMGTSNPVCSKCVYIWYDQGVIDPVVVLKLRRKDERLRKRKDAISCRD